MIKHTITTLYNNPPDPCATDAGITGVSPAPWHPSSLWIPLHEATEAWATFGKDASSSPALIATGEAFLALSWESSALRHQNMATQDRACGFLRSAERWQAQVVADLLEAIHRWDMCLTWLERLANHRILCTTQEDLERVRSYITKATEFRTRLSRLMEYTRTLCESQANGKEESR